MKTSKSLQSNTNVLLITDPPIAQALMSKVKWAWIWVVPRLFIGWTWLKAGWGKLTNPAWVGTDAGQALTGFINGALTKTTGAHPEVQSWYAAFLRSAILPNANVWSYVVSIGEALVGIGLLLGAFTGIAAFFGIFMNLNYLLAGAVSVNPILLVLSVFIVLAWKTSGWWGLDRWLLPGLGTPWSPGLVFKRRQGKKPVD
jgi:thiosulfate dehydrogenase [quinone] large subunit